MLACVGCLLLDVESSAVGSLDEIDSGYNYLHCKNISQ